MERKSLTVTVQGVINPVPAALESENAGFQSSKSSYRKNSSSVANLAGQEENTTGNIHETERYLMENPFRRNSGIQRSPPKVVNGPTVTDIVAVTTPPQAQDMEHNSFIELGSLITKLMEFVKNKNNVHHAIKEQIRVIKATYNKTKAEATIAGNKEVLQNNEQSTQTTPNIIVETQDLKRSRDSADSPTNEKTPKRLKKGKKLNANKESEVTVPDEINQKELGKESWKTVKHKKNQKRELKTKNNRKRAVKTDAMIISTKGETTYADILRKIKADPALQEFGKNVSRIRRTQKGDLLLEINPTKEDSVEKFQEQVEKSIGLQADIRTNKPEIRIVCKDLDEVTTKQEICTALKNELGIDRMDESNIKSLRRSYGDTQTAVISLPVDLGSRILKLGKIKIGWVICRIREYVQIKRCYRCLGFGHTASSCTNEHDRSQMCRKCGENGHIAKVCTRTPECMLCKELGNADILHIAGSGRCLVFKMALHNYK